MSLLPQLRLARSLNAFTHVVPDSVLLESLAAAASPGLPLSRRLVAVKANINVQSWPCSAASLALHNYISPYDATCVRRLKQNGAVLAGLTNMDEFGMGSDGSTSAHGPTRSPWGPGHSTGGSSSGSAVAVACRAVFAALGSDTGGSVRLPAARCGVVGIKPSRGAVSRHGLIAYASSLDTVGVLAESVDAAALVLDAIAGPDPLDATCDTADWRPCVGSGVPRAPKVGIPVDLLTADLCPATLAAWRATARALQAGGAEIVDVSVPSLAHSLPAYYVLALAEASSNLARYDGVRFGVGVHAASGGSESAAAFERAVTVMRSKTFGEEVQLRLLMGALALSADSSERFYRRAARFRAQLRKEFDEVFVGVDVLLLPTCPSVMPQPGASPYFEDLLTVPASLAGLAAASVPVGVCPQAAAPIGMQVVTKNTWDCVRAARLVEACAEYKLPAFAAV